MFVELFALKCFTLGSVLTGYGVWRWAKYKFVCKHFEIERVLEIKKP